MLPVHRTLTFLICFPVGRSLPRFALALVCSVYLCAMQLNPVRAQFVSDHGISGEDDVVVYDAQGMFRCVAVVADHDG